MTSTSRPSYRRDVIGGVLAYIASAPSVFATASIMELAGFERDSLFTACCLAAGLATFTISAVCRVAILFTPSLSLVSLFTFSMYLGAGIPRDAALLAFAASGCILVLLGLIHIGPALLDAVPAYLTPAASAGIGLLLIAIGLRQAGVLTDHPVSLVVLGDLVARAPLVTGVGIGAMIALSLRAHGQPLLWGMGITLLAGIGLGVVSADRSMLFPFIDFGAVSAFDAISGTAAIEALKFIPSIMIVALMETMGILAAMKGVYGADWQENPAGTRRLWMGSGISTAIGPVLGLPGPLPGPETLIGKISGGQSHRIGYTTGALFLLTPVIPVFLHIFGEGYQTGPDRWLHPLVAPLMVFSGLLCLSRLGAIAWNRMDQAIPAAILISIIPLSFSIIHGVAFALLAYAFIETLRGNITSLGPIYLLLVPLLLLRYLVL